MSSRERWDSCSRRYQSHDVGGFSLAQSVLYISGLFVSSCSVRDRESSRNNQKSQGQEIKQRRRRYSMVSSGDLESKVDLHHQRVSAAGSRVVRPIRAVSIKQESLVEVARLPDLTCDAML
jgi:hypothetical protein